MYESLVLFYVVCAVTIWMYRQWTVSKRRGPKYPPGPLGVPGMGSLMSMRPNPSEIFVNFAQKYGPVFSIQLGWTEWVIINNYLYAKLALVKHGNNFSGRPNVKVFSDLAEGNGIGFVDFGDKWKSQRKFGMVTLTGFGLGKTSLEGRIHDEISFMLDAIKRNGGQPFDCLDLLTNVTSNIICGVVMGSRFSYDDKRFQSIVRHLRTSFSGNLDARLLAVMTLVPGLRFLPILRGSYKRQFYDLYAIFDILREIVNEHRENFNKNEIRDFIDAFLDEMRKSKDEDSHFTEKQLFHYVRDLFIAGTDTSSNSLRWAVLSLVHYPDCQEKVQQEIDTVIGKEMPRMQHMTEMPYTRAWILELMRHRTVFPLLAPRKTTDDVILGPYRIPKNTPVMFNLWAIHQNPAHFKDPEKFLPERFLDANGNFVPDDHVIPFSLGPRNCMGNQLVRMEMFLILVGVLQKFSIRPDPNKSPPSFHGGVFGFTYVPYHFKNVFVERNVLEKHA